MNTFQRVASKLAIFNNLDISNGQDRSYYRQTRNEYIKIFRSKHWKDGSDWTFQDVLNYKTRYKNSYR